MALPRGIDLLPDEVRVLLLPGERPLAYELATQFAGHTGVGGDPRPRPGLHFDPDPLAGGIGADQGWVDSLIGGVNSAGAVGSLADGFTQALGVSASMHLVVTDRRLLVVGDEGSLRSTPVRIHFGVDRRAVVRAERAPRMLQRGRVRLAFADGSWAMAMLGLLKTGAVTRLLHTLPTA